MIALYFLIPTVIVQFLNPIAELVIPIEISTKQKKKKKKIEIETHPVTVEINISKF